MSPVRVVLVDDHPVVLAGVKALLQSGPDFEVVGEAGTGTAALEVVCRLQPDVAVIDISMPDMNGFELAEELRQRCPDVRLLALTVHEDTAYIHRLLAAGVRGYLLKRAAADDLPHAIRAVASGGVYLDPSAAVALASAGDPQPQRVGEPESELSARERDVLRLTGQGFTNKEIAARLDVSVKSVETYKARAAAKLNLRTRAEIVRYVASRGWIET
jgi:DNA-binding NarL/FixJ family response regulator